MAEWYENYLQSDHWQRTRIQRLLRANINKEWNLIQCERKECGLFVPLMALDVHHLTYARVGSERMEDLQVLCRSCHGVVHGYQPALWWEWAKRDGSLAICAATIRKDRNLRRLGDVLNECLSYCDVRQVSLPFRELAQ